MPVQLESGLWQFQPEEIERLGEAAASHASSRGITIDLTRPVTMDTWVSLAMEDAILKDDIEFLKVFFEIVIKEIELRERKPC